MDHPVQFPDRVKKFEIKFNFPSGCHVMSVYTISLKTGTMVGAGTDANVFIRMIGEHGSTEEMKLKTEMAEMERGMTDTYSVPSEDVGTLKKVGVVNTNFIVTEQFNSKIFFL